MKRSRLKEKFGPVFQRSAKPYSFIPKKYFLLFIKPSRLVKPLKNRTGNRMVIILGNLDTNVSGIWMSGIQIPFVVISEKSYRKF